MAGPSYALSEILIVLAAIWSATKLARDGKWFGAIGCLVLGVVAAIGAYRFALGQVQELATIHKEASRIAGGFAVTLIGSQFLLTLPKINQHSQITVWLIFTSIGCMIAMLILPGLSMALVAVWMLAPIIVTALAPSNTLITRVAWLALSSLFLVNYLMVRQSPHFAPEVNWHLYHTLIAVWLIAIVFLIRHLQRN